MVGTISAVFADLDHRPTPTDVSAGRAWAVAPEGLLELRTLATRIAGRG